MTNDSSQNYVHFSRAVDPAKPDISPEVKTRHDESVRRYPELNLSEAEFVISAVRRHPIGLFLPIGLTVFFVALIISLVINYAIISDSIGVLQPPAYGLVLLVGGLLSLLFIVGCYISVWIYSNNKFYLTNESVIQELQIGLFTRREQTVSLANIEDASYHQQGVIQSMFDYGSIRLSTEGDETTYRFEYVAKPKQQIALLNNAVEAFKNGRPIEG